MAEESLKDIFIYDTKQMIDEMENILLDSETKECLEKDYIDSIFRIMHTVKGSASMMQYEGLSNVAHKVENIFSYFRNNECSQTKVMSAIDIALKTCSSIQKDIENLKTNDTLENDYSELIEKIDDLNKNLGNEHIKSNNSKSDKIDYKMLELEVEDASDFDETAERNLKLYIKFEQNCKMEGIRAFDIIQRLKNNVSIIGTVPEDINANDVNEKIAEDGLKIFFTTDKSKDDIYKILEKVLFLHIVEIEKCDKDIESVKKSIDCLNNIIEDDNDEECECIDKVNEIMEKIEVEKNNVDFEEKRIESELIDRDKELFQNTNASQVYLNKEDQKTNNENKNIKSKKPEKKFISINVNKLDHLLNVVGELVTARSSLSESISVENEEYEKFESKFREMSEYINNLRDIVMDLRMVQLKPTFAKMKRLIRDIAKEESKKVTLIEVGSDTEVDKNIVEKIQSPLMHIIRNSVDHGIEDVETRKKLGKNPTGIIKLLATSMGGNVVIKISDDGKGLNKEKLIAKAYELGITNKPIDQISDKEAYRFILAPGFSTNLTANKFSGRGVGMDVVFKGINKLGGSVVIESEEGKGTTIILYIPLTLAITDGIGVYSGSTNYVVPINNMLSIITLNKENVLKDSQGNNFIVEDNICYPVISLNKYFDMELKEESIAILLEGEEGKKFCILVERIDGVCQVVVKPVSSYLETCVNKINGIGGMSIMGDGSISYILDINAIASELDELTEK